ncbi:ABC transporter substrate-binding protein [Paenibacillus radicis (ex Gao et al. 2016)]|uniref:ABC transporter substrate-binding protein n=1 Tax=Paenibacillus radicis (ex Gao et al. 2016) TaxID=1737354 RepID=A0A917HH49_9BACL|nr:ABC transporter substrate-binding protein [Paenibacillus radicis (ex Gao et al. 2016)]GGG79082.1 hypothetical protein GCM10010918_40110 [Paenibacillus radicis (ex Gao et al. 2016)]
MQPFEHFIMLAHQLNSHEQLEVPREVTLEQVADALHCTPRNAKLVLRKLTDAGLITWQAGRGRGNRSKLAFLAGKTHILIELSRQYAEKEEYKQAFELLQRYDAGTQAIESFTEWLSGSFGFGKSRGEGNETVDTLRLPLSQPILTLDPSECFYSLESHMVQQLFDPLVRYDAAEDRILPQIAHTWDSSEDATLWTFHLRKGVFFHNGKELGAEDVVFTFKRMQTGKRNSWPLRFLIGVEAASPRTVRFKLAKPNRIFPRFLCLNALSILPLDYAGENEKQFWKQPIGTGPFQLAEWTDERFVLHANARYYQGRPHLDSVHIVFIPSSASADQALWQQLLYDPGKQEDDLESWQSTVSKHCCTSLLSWNMNKPGQHQSADFRRAVDLILNRSQMLRELGGYRLHIARGFFHDEQAETELYRYDLEEARRLLADYDGTPLSLGTYGKHLQDAEWVQQQCAVVGIPLHIRYEQMDHIQEIPVMNEMDIILHAVVFPEEEICMIENYEQAGSFTKQFQTPDWHEYVREHVDQALNCDSSAERWRLLTDIETRLRDDAHALFLLHSRFQSYFSPSYRGVGINSHGWIDFKEIWRT